MERSYLATTTSLCVACSHGLEEPERPGRDQTRGSAHCSTFTGPHNYNHLKRVMSWCLRFVFNCRSSPEARLHLSKLSLSELQNTETKLIKLSQERSFKAERNKLLSTGAVSRGGCLSHLRPYLDEDGLIRVGGRLEKSALTTGQKHPIILHRTDRLAKLICTQLHVDNLHVGPTALLALMTLQFHVIGAKHLTKGVS